MCTLSKQTFIYFENRCRGHMKLFVNVYRAVALTDNYDLPPALSNSRSCLSVPPPLMLSLTPLCVIYIDRHSRHCQAFNINCSSFGQTTIGAYKLSLLNASIAKYTQHRAKPQTVTLTSKMPGSSDSDRKGAPRARARLVPPVNHST